MPYSVVASGLFSLRNADKTTNGEIGRLPVTVGQTTSVLKAAMEHNNPASIFVKKVFNKVNNDQVARRLGKVATFASENVNPLIVVSSGIKVAMADKEDRKKALISETGCLLGMFAGEGWMKKNLDGLLAKLPIDNKWIPFIRGAIFVAGSISCSTLGQKIGKKVAEWWDKPIASQDNAQSHLVYNPLKFAA